MALYETIEHTADIGIRAWGKSLAEAFENTARGMFSLICDPALVREEESFAISVEADDRETLLVEWLNELLYLFESRGVLLAGFKIGNISETALEATVFGERLDFERHRPEADIKAATYHMLKVEQSNGDWEAIVIFDV
jgi:SHS2 domain-containing protein